MSDASITTVMPKVDLDQQALRLAGMADQIRETLVKTTPSGSQGAVQGLIQLAGNLTRLGRQIARHEEDRNKYLP